MESQVQMNATTMIHGLVREGRATPEDGALLLELRRHIVAREERAQRTRGVAFLGAIGVFFLALLGLRKENS
jgi:hypothetical protein